MKEIRRLEVLMEKLSKRVKEKRIERVGKKVKQKTTERDALLNQLGNSEELRRSLSEIRKDKYDKYFRRADIGTTVGLAPLIGLGSPFVAQRIAKRRAETKTLDDQIAFLKSLAKGRQAPPPEQLVI